MLLVREAAIFSNRRDAIRCFLQPAPCCVDAYCLDGFGRSAAAHFGIKPGDVPGAHVYLVNNAGNSQHINFENVTEADFDAVVNVHFKGVFFLTQKLLPLMNDGGRIVNLSSGLTRVSVPGSSACAAAKGAIEVLTRYLAKELGPRRITANVVAPGPVQTDFSGGMVRDNPEVNKMVSAMTALGRPGAGSVRHPTESAAICHCNGHAKTARCDHVAEWSLGNHIAEP